MHSLSLLLPLSQDNISVCSCVCVGGGGGLESEGGAWRVGWGLGRWEGLESDSLEKGA